MMLTFIAVCFTTFKDSDVTIFSLFFLFLFVQATAEQIRLAQMISDHNDADFEEKVKQVRRDVRSWLKGK